MSTDDRSDEDQALDAPVVTRVARGEWITLAAFVALALLVHQQILGPLTERGYASGDAVNNAALFPRLVANLILGLCALQLVQLLRRRVVLSAEFLQQATRANARRCGIGFAILVAYLAGLPVLGFYPATVLFVLAMLVTLNTRPVWVGGDHRRAAERCRGVCVRRPAACGVATRANWHCLVRARRCLIFFWPG